MSIRGRLIRRLGPVLARTRSRVRCSGEAFSFEAATSAADHRALDEADRDPVQHDFGPLSVETRAVGISVLIGAPDQA